MKRPNSILVRCLCMVSVTLALVSIWVLGLFIALGDDGTVCTQEDKPAEETAEPEIMVLVRYATPEEEAERDRETVEAIARTVGGEARGCSTTEQAAVVWCILNRVDSPEFPNDPLLVCQQAYQFDGYSADCPVEEDLVALVQDVLGRWELEKTAVGTVGRVLPAEYLYFEGDGRHNHYRTDYIHTGETWDWSLDSPYSEQGGL